MNPAARTCPACHQPLHADAPQGLCPQCLAKSALGSQPGTEETLASGSKLGGSGPAAIQTEIARLFPQLEILEPLGQGGMGMVYKARQLQLDRVVALKVMRADLSRDPAFAERFAREARALAKLNHPNIVSVFDFGQSGGHCWILMEYVDGTNLRELLRTKTLQPREALGIVPKVCDALQYAHDEGIVHRDIKPENILLDKKGRVKIADFGLAKLVGKDTSEFNLTATGMTLGTPRYMAPEQFDKPQEVDHRADIYSLGVVLYEMLTGEVPMGRFAPPSATIGVDVRLDEIVLRTLEKEPSRRYQHVSEVRTQVESVTATQAQPRTPDVEPFLATPWGMKSPWLGWICWMLVIFLAQYPIKMAGAWLQLSPALATGLQVAFVIGLAVLFLTTYLGLRGTSRSAGYSFSLLGMAASLLVVFATLTETVLEWAHGRFGSRPGNHDALVIYTLQAGLFVWSVGAMVRILRRNSSKGATKPPTKSGGANQVGEPRLSRLALWGAIWVGLGLMALGILVLILSTTDPDTIKHELPKLLGRQVPMGMLLLLGGLFVSAAFGSTILGVVAIGQIKRSAGKIYGLRLAAAEALFIPLLLLMVGAVRVLDSHSVGIAIGLVIGVFAVGAAWRAIVGQPASPKGSALTSEDVRAKLRLAGIGLLIVGVLNAFAGLVWIGNNVSALTDLWQHNSPWGWQLAHTFTSLCIIVVVYHQVGVGLWLMNPDDDGNPTFVLVMAALCPPGCVLGLPVAIYAFMQLTKPEGKALLAALREQPAPVTTATEPGRPLDHRVSEALMVGLPGWFNRRAPWMQKLIQGALTLSVACATLVFLGFNIHSKTDVTAGQVSNTGAVQVGQPSPWLTVDFSSTNHSFAIHWFSASLWIGLTGLALGCLSERLRRSVPGFDEERDRRKRQMWLVVMIVVLVLYVAALVVNGLIMSGATSKAARGVMDRAFGTKPAVAPSPYTFAGLPAPFVKGADGPELGAPFVKQMGFTPLQVTELNKTFQSYYREFLSLERRHTELSRNAQNHVVVKISAFPEESLALAQRMTQELRCLVGKDVIPAPQPGQLVNIGLFRHAGEWSVSAELWKDESLYYFKEERTGVPNAGNVNVGGKAGRSTSGAKIGEVIPDEYRVYWQE